MKSASADTPLSQDIISALRYWLRGRRGLILAGVAILGMAAALGWPSLVAAGVIPLLISLAPCLIMCGLGFCFMKSCSKGPATSQSASPGETTTSPAAMPTVARISPESVTPAATPNVAPESSATMTPLADRHSTQSARCCQADEPAADSRRA